jgi:hypothetical protein
VRAAAAATALALAAPAAAQQPHLDMTAFFAGRTRAENVLKVVLKDPARLVVDSVGRAQGRDFVLVDTVREEGKPVRERIWVMRPTGFNRFRGTLTDATGPVDVMVAGNGATIRYTMKGGLNIVQELVLEPDGRSLSNHIVARKFGLKFARVDGVIRKLD